jgi:hypothetical protein
VVQDGALVRLGRGRRGRPVRHRADRVSVRRRTGGPRDVGGRDLDDDRAPNDDAAGEHDHRASDDNRTGDHDHGTADDSAEDDNDRPAAAHHRVDNRAAIPTDHVAPAPAAADDDPATTATRGGNSHAGRVLFPCRCSRANGHGTLDDVRNPAVRWDAVHAATMAQSQLLILVGSEHRSGLTSAGGPLSTALQHALAGSVRDPHHGSAAYGGPSMTVDTPCLDVG